MATEAISDTVPSNSYAILQLLKRKINSLPGAEEIQISIGENYPVTVSVKRAFHIYFLHSANSYADVSKSRIMRNAAVSIKIIAKSSEIAGQSETLILEAIRQLNIENKNFIHITPGQMRNEVTSENNKEGGYLSYSIDIELQYEQPPYTTA